MREMQTEAQKNPYDTEDQEYDVNQQLQENENEADVQGSSFFFITQCIMKLYPVLH